MKEISSYILLLVGFVLMSCGEKNDLTELPTSLDGERKISVNMKFDSKALEESVTNIESFNVFAYVNDTLINTKGGAISNEEDWNMELYLDESVTLFAYANVEQVVLSDSLSKAQLWMDDKGEHEVFVSELVEMVSDNSLDTIYFNLNRIVGQMAFQPNENQATLNAITAFDAIDVVFINAGVAYLPSNATSIQDTITIRTTKVEGFKAEVFSFPTLAGNSGTIEVIYYKDEQIVNKTIRALEVAINIEPSKRSVIYMPLLDDAYLQNTFSSKSTSIKKTGTNSGVTVKEYQF